MCGGLDVLAILSYKNVGALRHRWPSVPVPLGEGRWIAKVSGHPVAILPEVNRKLALRVLERFLFDPQS